MRLWFTTKPSMVKAECTLAYMFKSPTAVNICVRNQEEHDLLYAYSVVWGREIKIDIFSPEWLQDKVPNSPIGPTLFTTWDPRVPGIFLNGTPGFETHPEPVRSEYVL